MIPEGPSPVQHGTEIARLGARRHRGRGMIVNHWRCALAPISRPHAAGDDPLHRRGRAHRSPGRDIVHRGPSERPWRRASPGNARRSAVVTSGSPAARRATWAEPGRRWADKCRKFWRSPSSCGGCWGFPTRPTTTSRSPTRTWTRCAEPRADGAKWVIGADSQPRWSAPGDEARARLASGRPTCCPTSTRTRSGEGPAATD